jgi:transketolase
MRSGAEAAVDTPALALAIRRHSVRMANSGGGSHVASALSMADIIAVLYGKVLTVDPSNPRAADRDRFILSKGHAGAGLYACLAERGFMPISRLATHYQNGSELSGHVSHKGIPGVEVSTGSLGHGLAIAAGMALSAKLDGATHRVFVLLSDGECDEGSTWEAALFAGHHRFDNLVVIVDYNEIQSLGRTAEILDLEPFAEKWRAFGWGVAEVDGHDHARLVQVLTGIPAAANRPTCVLAHTVKGKGVSFMENTVLWHYRCPRGEEFAAAMRELGEEP